MKLSKRKLVDTVIVHCAASQPVATIDASTIDLWHRQRGWNGNGYHFVIKTDGTIQSRESGNKCRDLDLAGAHVGDCGPGWNARSIGICLVGGVDKSGKSTNNFTTVQFASLSKLIKEIMGVYSIDMIMGHRDLIKLTKAPPKDCPCFDVSDFLKLNGIEVNKAEQEKESD